MNSSTHHRTTGIGNAILLPSALIGTAFLLVQNLKMDAFGHRTMIDFMHGHPPLRLAGLQEIDDLVTQAAKRAGDGNLLVSADSDPEAVSILHPRAVYGLWPRRLYAVRPDMIVLDSAQIGPATRPSDPAWLEQHNVRTTVRFHMRTDRGGTGDWLRVERVDPVPEQ